jgi:Zinc finger, C3HC4 type (RING finger)
MDITGLGTNLFASANFLDNDAGASDEQFLNLVGGIQIDTVIENLLESIMNMIEDEEIDTNTKLRDLRIKFLEFASKGYNTAIEEIIKPLDENGTVIQMKDVLDSLNRVDFNPSSQGHFRDLLIDISGSNNDYSDLEERIIAVTEQYKVAYVALFDADKEVREITSKFKLMAKKIDDFMNLESNSASLDMYKSFANYLIIYFKNTNLLEKFNKYVRAYKDFTQLRKLLKVSSISSNNDTLPLCSICISHSVTYTLNPCGHTFCHSCAHKQIGHCFICRTKITNRLKLYFS